jgi:DNA modification methylase/transcriptional regulator with XRE-family HTH domain
VTFIESEGVRVYHGDCIEVMRSLPDNSVDSVVTDPPYGLGFMGKDWDSVAALASRPPSAEKHDNAYPRTGKGKAAVAFDGNGFQLWFTDVATEALRVLKPGGHLLAFGGTRTWHRLAVAIEDAGFEVRDSMAWMYGSGFPKSLDVSKAIDKRGGAQVAWFGPWFRKWREQNGVTQKQVAALFPSKSGGLTGCVANWELGFNMPTADQFNLIRDTFGLPFDTIAEAEREVIGTRTNVATRIYDNGEGERLPPEINITAPATPAAQQWQGWGTALKPAHEPIVVARKPLIGTVAENILTHGTGALNIDGCRIAGEADRPTGLKSNGARSQKVSEGWDRPWKQDERADRIVGDGERTTSLGRWPANVILDESQAAELDKQSGNRPGSSTASKTSLGSGEKTDTHGWGGIITSQYPDSGGASRFFYVAKASKKERPNVDGVAHPTVKPISLMRYLVRLVTPPGGTVLEPFAGSGTTVEACILEGFDCIAIEMTDDYLPLIAERVRRSTDDKEGRLL